MAGRIAGTCGGPVIVEAVSAAGVVVGRVTTRDARWQISGLAALPAHLRWGCDGDGDGAVVAADVLEAGPPRLALAGAVLVLPPRGPPLTP